MSFWKWLLGENKELSDEMYEEEFSKHVENNLSDLPEGDIVEACKKARMEWRNR